MKNRLANNLSPALAALSVAIFVWWLLVVTFDIKPYLLPSPWSVMAAGLDAREELTMAVWLTARAAVSGLILSILVGSVIAIVFSQSRWIRVGCFPYAVLLQTVPIVAIAPLMLFWSGPGLRSVILISFMVSLFPIITNVTAGLTAIDPGFSALFKLNQANRLQRICKLQIPHAIPHLVTGMRTSAGLAVIGAIVGEYFAGVSTVKHGLGFMVAQKITSMQTDVGFAAVVMSVLLGAFLFLAVGLLRSTVLTKWCDSRH